MTTSPASAPRIASSRRYQLAVPEGLAVQEADQDGLEDVGVVPVVDPELYFGQVGVQVLGADLVPCSDDGALEKAPDALHAVRVDVSDHPLLFGALDRLMARVVVGDPEVGLKLVGVNGLGVGPRVPGDERVERGPLDVGDGLDTHLAATLDGSGDPRLADAVSGTCPAPLAADQRLIHLDNTKQGRPAREISPHGRPDTMAQVPRGLVGDADGPLDLVRADALLRLANQVDRHEPLPERKVRVVEDGPRGDAEAVAAPVAIELVAGADLRDGHVAAARASNRPRPAQLLKIFAASLFIAELLDQPKSD